MCRCVYAGLCQISWRFTYLCWNIPKAGESQPSTVFWLCTSGARAAAQNIATGKNEQSHSLPGSNSFRPLRADQ
jgi:hypothetical protein